jgi:hypothetical protein
VYADTDSLFLKKEGATRDNYENLKNILSLETGLSISLNYHYKFLVLLPLEADDKLEVLKHYFRITYGGCNSDKSDRNNNNRRKWWEELR